MSYEPPQVGRPANFEVQCTPSKSAARSPTGHSVLIWSKKVHLVITGS